jgi:multiple sugar transport system substrate-binding protein
MKSVRYLLILALLVGLGGFATAQPAPEPEPEITLTWWINPWRIRPPGFPEGESPTGDEFPAWISEEFMKLPPNVTVNYELVPNSGYLEKINTAIFAGNPPDVLRSLNFNSEWAREGLLEPIDEYLTDEDWDDFIDYTLADGLIDGKHYIWPWNNSNNGMGSTMLLNPAIFEERGVALPAEPYRHWTIEEFLEAAEQLTFTRDDGTQVYATTVAAMDTENTLAWLFRFGASYLNEEGTEFVLNSPEGVRGLQLLVDLVDKYGVAPKGGEALDVYGTIDNFHQGRAAMGYGGIYEIGRIDRYVQEGRITDPIQVIIAPFPHDPETGPVAYETSGGFAVFKQKDEYRQKMAMQLARFITNTENTALLEDLLYVTARKSSNALLTFDSVAAYTDVRAQVETYVNAISYGVPYFGHRSVDTSAAKDYLTGAVQAALSGQKTPQQALDDFVRQANREVFGR